jgi:hypothetical protein
MATKWIYAYTEYTTQADVDAAVVAQRDRLDNNPTDWVVVKELTGNASDGWVVPSETLTDDQINGLDSTKHYSVAAIHKGDNDLGLTASEAAAKVAEHRAAYAEYMRVNTIAKIQEYSPSNVDMSAY